MNGLWSERQFTQQKAQIYATERWIWDFDVHKVLLSVACWCVIYFLTFFGNYVNTVFLLMV